MNKIEERVCNRHGLAKHVLSSDGRFRCQPCRVLYVKTRRKKVKAALIAHLGGKCERCSYDRCLEALEFHHKEPGEKDFTIAHKLHWSLERLKKEVEKCHLLCANCHREVHVEEGDYGG